MPGVEVLVLVVLVGLWVVVRAGFKRGQLPATLGRLYGRVQFWLWRWLVLEPLYPWVRRAPWTEVVPGQLWLGKTVLPRHVPQLKALGIDRVLNLQDEYDGPLQAYAAHRIRQLHLPVVDHCEPSPSQLRQAVRFLRHSLAHGHRVYVHCLAADHQILTDRGFLGLPQLAFAWNRVRIATINPCNHQLEYQSASNFIFNQSLLLNDDLIQFPAMKAGARETGLAPTSAAILSVTLGHEMYVQIGMMKDNGEEEWSFGWQKETAGDLFQMGQSSPQSVVRILLQPPQGLNAPGSSANSYWSHLFPSKQLNLQSESQFCAFLTNFGYWLGSVTDWPNVAGEEMEWVWSLKKEHARLLLSSIERASSGLEEDCHDANFSRCIRTCIPAVRDTVSRLAFHAGCCSFVESFGGRCHERLWWRIRLSDELYSTVRLNDLKRVKNVDPTFCVTVPNGLIVARRATLSNDGVLLEAGAAAVCGNCQGGHGRSAAVVFAHLALDRHPSKSLVHVNEELSGKWRVRTKLHSQPSILKFLQEEEGKESGSE